MRNTNRNLLLNIERFLIFGEFRKNLYKLSETSRAVEHRVPPDSLPLRGSRRVGVAVKRCKNEVAKIMAWQDFIESTPNILRGKPRIKGTRIPASLILGYLAKENTPEQIIAEFPDLTNDQIIACLDYARELADFEAAI